ncbi:uncharacterized protein LOC133868695 isoform X2 [Alnus glutinosa]|uniref:uncharacterized protein LOC133868695 isoform X2 n=1 Tax=Alnus glutinosa TaxID=3517 RepID=UPI002D76C7A6|nr:uncharacterized protein LOC133868695 isoform X2 [Alnus glutinosa]
MLNFSKSSQTGSNFDKINFDKIVTESNLRKFLGYQWIRKNKDLLHKKGKNKTPKKTGPGNEASGGPSWKVSKKKTQNPIADSRTRLPKAASRMKHPDDLCLVKTDLVSSEACHTSTRSKRKGEEKVREISKRPRSPSEPSEEVCLSFRIENLFGPVPEHVFSRESGAELSGPQNSPQPSPIPGPVLSLPEVEPEFTCAQDTQKSAAMNPIPVGDEGQQHVGVEEPRPVETIEQQPHLSEEQQQVETLQGYPEAFVDAFVDAAVHAIATPQTGFVESLRKSFRNVMNASEMQAHFVSASSQPKVSDAEVERLKSDIKARQKQIEKLQDDVSEVKATNALLRGQLFKANEAKKVHSAELSAARARGVEQEMEAEMRYEKMEREAEMRYEKIRKKFQHSESKAKRFRKELAGVPWFMEISWGRGANWMDKKYRSTYKNFQFDPATENRFSLDNFPGDARRELRTKGQRYFPDVPDWGENAEPSAFEFTPVSEDERGEGEGTS